MNDIFHERFNRVMKEKNLSPGMVAIKSGMSEKQIRNYQKGQSRPGGYSLKVLAKALGVSVDYLLGIEEGT